jgi:hypothetical protein
MIPNNANQYLPPVITIPSALEITAISQSNPMQITTTMNSDQVNTYQMSQVVVLTVPVTFGMWQANGLKGIISGVAGNIISLAIDSTNFDPFVNPNNGQIASLAPSGSKNLAFNNFTNQVPFQSLNNLGN